MAATPILSLRIYRIAEVDEFLRLTRGTASRWIDGYRRGSRHYEPIIRPETTKDRWATWGELVEVRLISEYRDAGVRVSRLRGVIERLRESVDMPYPLAHAKPFLDLEGREVVLRVQEQLGIPDELRLVVRSGQTVLPAAPLERFQEVTTFSPTGEAERIRLYNTVVPDPQRIWGAPAIADRRLGADILAGAHRTGLAPEDIATLWSVDVESVNDAIHWDALQAADVA